VRTGANRVSAQTGDHADWIVHSIGAICNQQRLWSGAGAASLATSAELLQSISMPEIKASFLLLLQRLS
jgi:hypothetical protein